MVSERTKREAKELTDELLGDKRGKRPYAPADISFAVQEAMEDVIIERRLQARETPRQTKLRHRIEARAKRDMKEKESAKRDVRKEWLPDNFPEGKVLNGMASLFAIEKKKREAYQQQIKEAAEKERESFYRVKRRNGWLLDEKLIRQSRARQKQARDEARIRRRGYP